MGLHVGQEDPHPLPASHLPPHLFPQGHPSAPALSTLSHVWNLDRRSVSHMIIYMFQCYSLRSSHSLPLSQSPKVCSLHLCLFCCLTYRVICLRNFLKRTLLGSLNFAPTHTYIYIHILFIMISHTGGKKNT